MGKRYKMAGMAVCALLLSSCCTSERTITYQRRDTTVAFSPKDIRDTLRVDTLIISSSADCDTLAILERYGSFDVQKVDSSYYWRAKYDAVNRKLTLFERRKPEVRVIPVETVYTKTVIRKLSLVEIAGYSALGSVCLIGVLLILKVLLRL